MADHLGLDLNLVELLAGVDTNDAANHLGDDNHVTEVSLDDVGLLVGLGLLLGLAELLDETHGAALQATVDPAAGTGVDDIAELVGGEVQKAVKRDSMLAMAIPCPCSMLFLRPGACSFGSRSVKNFKISSVGNRHECPERVAENTYLSRSIPR